MLKNGVEIALAPVRKTRISRRLYGLILLLLLAACAKDGQDPDASNALGIGGMGPDVQAPRCKIPEEVGPEVESLAELWTTRLQIRYAHRLNPSNIMETSCVGSIRMVDGVPHIVTANHCFFEESLIEAGYEAESVLVEMSTVALTGTVGSFSSSRQSKTIEIGLSGLQVHSDEDGDFFAFPLPEYMIFNSIVATTTDQNILEGQPNLGESTTCAVLINDQKIVLGIISRGLDGMPVFYPNPDAPNLGEGDSGSPVIDLFTLMALTRELEGQITAGELEKQLEEISGPHRTIELEAQGHTGHLSSTVRNVDNAFKVAKDRRTSQEN